MEPGGSGKIPLTLATRNRSGRLEKSVTVYTNAPGTASAVRLTIHGDVWEPIGVTPRNASFGRLTAEAAQSGSLTRKLTLVNNLEEPANLTDVRCTNPVFNVETTTIEAGKKYELSVTLVAPPRRGNNGGNIEMSTGIKEAPTLSIPISLFVMSDIDIQPERLVIAQGRTAETKRLFTVRNNTKQPLTISELKSTSPALKVALQGPEVGMMFRIVVEVAADYEPAAGGDSITFKTDCPTAPEITIPVTQPPAPRKRAVPKTAPPRGTPQSEKQPAAPGAKPGE